MAKSRTDRLVEIMAKFHEAYDLLDDLATEVEESVSAVEGTNLENTERNQRMKEANETLKAARDAISSALDDLDSVEF